MLYIDVDGMKDINDTLGHEAGDAHLVNLAQIVTASIRDSDHFARVGGDEFAVFLTGQDVTSAHGIAARLVATCARQPQPIRLSIGLVPSSAATSLEPLIRMADDAMYDAKRSGGGVKVDRTPGTEPGRVDPPADLTP